MKKDTETLVELPYSQVFLIYGRLIVFVKWWPCPNTFFNIGHFIF